jgi:hypothetical protein
MNPRADDVDQRPQHLLTIRARIAHRTSAKISHPAPASRLPDSTQLIARHESSPTSPGARDLLSPTSPGARDLLSPTSPHGADSTLRFATAASHIVPERDHRQRLTHRRGRPPLEMIRARKRRFPFGCTVDAAEARVLIDR